MTSVCFVCRAHTLRAVVELARMFPRLRVYDFLPAKTPSGKDWLFVQIGDWRGALCSYRHEGKSTAKLVIWQPGHTVAGLYLDGKGWQLQDLAN